jgi:peptide-methionine (S)-S-oxide reductase
MTLEYVIYKNGEKKMKLLIIILALTMNSITGMGQKLETATLGGGCFWCTEAVYKELKGVADVKPGYSGGHVKNPSYREVCNGNTGHAEVVQITFDPNVVSFSDILEVFFKTHDPTTLNRQGNDAGTQYRSVIFYRSEKQKEVAEKVVALFEKEKIYDKPIVTLIEPFKVFYEAEDYHHDYYERNKNQPYCQFVITPKLEKFEKIFKDKLKN